MLSIVSYVRHRQPVLTMPRLSQRVTTGLVVILTMLTAIPPALAADGVQQQALPNIVMIMVDDLGWMDLACQGNRLVETPHIDRLAQQGMRFTSAYAAAPVCSPTRAAVLTGQSPARLRLTNHLPDRASFTPPKAKLLPAPMRENLAGEQVTFAERLKEKGYATGFFGKWHLSGRQPGGRQGQGPLPLYPESQGFDVNIGGCSYGGPPTFFDPYKIHNLPSRKTGEYLPDRLADESIAFMKQHRDGPFLLCLWNYAVHWPMEAPEPLLKKYKNRRGKGLNDTRYGAMIEALDRSLGRLFAALDQLQLRDNTLLVFTSDNGGFAGVSDNRPLRAAKGHLYEGGIRVPMIVRWPGRVEAGSVCDVPVISMDFFPTFLAAADLQPKANWPADGENLLGLLAGKTKQLKRAAIYFHYPNYAWHRSNRLGSAMREGKYKLIERFDDGSLELYDLAADLGERTNLAAKLPDRAARMQRQLAAWRKSSGAALPVKREG